MKPLYWTRILVPAVPTERGSVETSDSPVQVIKLWGETNSAGVKEHFAPLCCSRR